MKKLLKSISLLALFVLVSSCNAKVGGPFQMDALSAWCIIGFDALDRTPAQRISMLKQMGITQYGYNKGKGDLSRMIEEFELAKANHIEINSVFLWLNAKRDRLGQLSPSNQTLLRNLAEVADKPSIWLSFSHNFFEGLSQEASVNRAMEMIMYVKQKTDSLGCKLALYNHHGWFGNPHHQIEILHRLKQDEITMVYNFHHAHDYVYEFPAIVKKIKPYLSYVNVSGVKLTGPKILMVGKGDHEFEMVKTLLDEGYHGPWGILGHDKTV